MKTKKKGKQKGEGNRNSRKKSIGSGRSSSSSSSSSISSCDCDNCRVDYRIRWDRRVRNSKSPIAKGLQIEAETHSSAKGTHDMLQLERMDLRVPSKGTSTKKPREEQNDMEDEKFGAIGNWDTEEEEPPSSSTPTWEPCPLRSLSLWNLRFWFSQKMLFISCKVNHLVENVKQFWA